MICQIISETDQPPRSAQQSNSDRREVIWNVAPVRHAVIRSVAGERRGRNLVRRALIRRVAPQFGTSRRNSVRRAVICGGARFAGSYTVIGKGIVLPREPFIIH